MILKTHRNNTVHEYFNKVKYVTSEYQKISDIDKNLLKRCFLKKIFIYEFILFCTLQTSWSEYPANRDEFFNGTKIPEGKHYYGPTIRGMEGVMPEAWYEQQMKIRHSPIDFHGFNNQSVYFPFWNSEPYTYVTSLLALSTYTNIQ